MHNHTHANTQAKTAQEAEALLLRRQQQAARLAALKEQQQKVQQEHQERMARARQVLKRVGPICVDSPHTCMTLAIV